MNEKADFLGHTGTESQATKIIFWYEEIALYGFICTMPLAIKYNTPFIVLLGLSWLINRRYLIALRSLKNNQTFYALVLFYLVTAVSLLYTENTRQGSQSLETRLAFLFVPVLLAGFELTPKLSNRIMRSYILAMVGVSMLSIASIFYYYGTDYDFAFFSFSLADFVGPSVNHYAIYIAFGLLFLMMGEKLFPKVLSVLIFVYLVVFLGLLSSRMAILAFAVVSTFFLLRKTIQATSRKVRVYSLLSIVAIIGGIAILGATVPYLRDRVAQMSKGFGNDPRYNIMKASTHLIGESPWIGYGVGDVQDELMVEYQRIGFEEGVTNEYNPHNDWTNAWLGAGIAGFVALFLLYFTFVKSIIKAPDFFKIAVLLVYFMCSQTETIFNRNKGALLFAFMITLVFIMQIGQTQNKEVHV